MNATLVWQRILWKETRHLGLLAVGIIVICTALSGLTGAAADYPGTTSNLLWTLAIFVPGCYAFGCTAMLLSGEKEAGTWDWLRNAGVPRTHVLLAKAAFVLASSYAMQLVMLGLALICTDLSRANPPPILRTDWPSYTGLITLQFAAVGWLACSLISRVIPAAMTWLGLLMGLSFIFALLTHPRSRFYEHGELALTLLIAMALIAAVAVSNYWWRSEFPLRDAWAALWQSLQSTCNAAVRSSRQLLPIVPAAWSDRIEFPTWPRRATANRLTSTEVYPFAEQRARQRLTWKSRRQLWHSIGMIVGAVLLTMLAIPLLSPWESKGTFLLGFTILPFVLGLLSFRDEQIQSRFRFYTDRGIAPRSLWWTTQYRWLLPIVVLCCVAYMIFDRSFYLPHRASYSIDSAAALIEQNMIGYFAASIAGSFLACYAVGQWASQTFRTTFFAMIGGIFLLIPVLAWCVGGMVLGVPVWLTGLPVGAWLLTVTWWRMPSWCLEQSSWLTYLRLGAAMLAPPILLFTITCGYRMVEYSAPWGEITAQILTSDQSTRPGFLRGMSQRLDSLIADADVATRTSAAPSSERLAELARRFQEEFQPWLIACSDGTAEEPLVLHRRPTPLLAACRHVLEQQVRWKLELQPALSLTDDYRELTSLSVWFLTVSHRLPDERSAHLELAQLLKLLPALFDMPQWSTETLDSTLHNVSEAVSRIPSSQGVNNAYWLQAGMLADESINSSRDPIEQILSRFPSERIRAERLLRLELEESTRLMEAQPPSTFHVQALQFEAVPTEEIHELFNRQQMRSRGTPPLKSIGADNLQVIVYGVETLDNARGALLSAACVLFRKVHNRLPVDHAELMTFWKPDPRLDLEPGPSQKLQYFPHGLTAQQLGIEGQQEQNRPHWEGQPLWYASTRYSRDTEAHSIRYPQWQQYSRRSIGDVFPIPPPVEPVEPPANAAQPENPASDLVGAAFAPVP